LEKRDKQLEKELDKIANEAKALGLDKKPGEMKQLENPTHKETSHGRENEGQDQSHQ